ncbi:hypothetical protein GCM10010417_05610 [Streptomyces carpaticus]
MPSESHRAARECAPGAGEGGGWGGVAGCAVIRGVASWGPVLGTDICRWVTDSYDVRFVLHHLVR